MNSYLQKALDSKIQMRSQLASLPIVEKMRLLDAMRVRALELHAAMEINARSGVVTEDPAPYQSSESREEG